MKLDRKNIKSLDMQEELEESYQGIELKYKKLKDQTLDLLRYGIKATDEKGHIGGQKHIKLPARTIDMVEAIKEKLPRGWVRHTYVLDRAIYAAGAKIILHFLNEGETKWDEVLLTMNLLAKIERLEEHDGDIKELEFKIQNCRNLSTKKREQMIDALKECHNQFKDIA